MEVHLLGVMEEHQVTLVLQVVTVEHQAILVLLVDWVVHLATLMHLEVAILAIQVHHILAVRMSEVEDCSLTVSCHLDLVTDNLAPEPGYR